MSETRKFSVHPKIIYDLIVAQAGSFAKAVLECVMNSVDAGASRVDITVDARTLRIEDDGQGFKSRQEIEQWFEVFGFPHTDGDRIYGQFGIGRGQLWSFCSTVWRTGAFEMTVDIKRTGLDYRLEEGLPAHTGVRIEGVFYESQLTSQLASFEKELEELARFAQIPVSLNGRQISRRPEAEKWDFDIPEAWIKTSETGALSVYNLGVLVRSYPDYKLGCGGTIVTKSGVRLKLNMARNDILDSQCDVWKRICRVVQVRSDQRVRTKRTRLTDGELENIARRFIAGELDYSTLSQTKLITDIAGRRHTLEDFIWKGLHHPQRPLTIAKLGNPMGERAHTRRLAFVLSPITLQRFGAETLVDLASKIAAAFPVKHATLGTTLRAAKAIEDLAVAVPTLRDGYDVLNDDELPKTEKAAALALASMSDHVSRAMVSAGFLSRSNAYRRLRIGVSDVAAAWTDGSSQITVEREQLKLMHQGLGGFVALVHILVHEYLHDLADVGSHTHDFEFYSRYHEATCGGAALHQAAARGLRRWVHALHTFKLRVPRVVVQHLDEEEKMRREAEQSASESPPTPPDAAGNAP